MSIFDDAVMLNPPDEPPPEIADGQYIDGQRVGDVNFFVDDQGRVVIIDDLRTDQTIDLSKSILVHPINSDLGDMTSPPGLTIHIDSQFDPIISP